MPATPPRLDPRLEQHELVRPCGEATGSPESVELGEDGHERVIRGLRGQVVELAVWHVAERLAAPVELEVRTAQQQVVQIGDRLVAHRGGSAQRGEPRV